MKKILPFALLTGISLLFFYKTFLFGKIPFPGDLLLAGYAPWNHESYAGYVAGAVPSKDQYFDVIRELYPWKTLVVGELKNRRWPLWNPYNFSGSPLLANYQSQVLYPFSVLYLVLPQPVAWTAMVILQPILGSLFTYLFATEIGLSSAAGVLAAILFNFSGFANVWMEFTTVWHTILWLPLLLYFVERSVRQKRLGILQQVLVIVSMFSAVTGGHPQDFINLFLFLIAYTAIRRAWTIFPLYALAIFIAAPQIFPTVELFRSSARVAHDYRNIVNTMLVQWWQLPLVTVADFFGNPATKSNITGDYVGKTLSVGVVGFLLAVRALSSLRWRLHKKFFALAAAVILLLTVRTPISALVYRYPWPVLSTGTPTRMLFLFAFAVAMLAGMGFDELRDRRVPTKLIIVTTVWFAALWLASFFMPGAAAVTRKAMLLATGVLGTAVILLLLSAKKNMLLLALIPLATIELLYAFVKFNPFVPLRFVYPQNKLIAALKEITGIDRFWGYGTARVESNFATQVNLYSPDGTDPLNLAWYNRLVQSSADGNLPVTFNRTTRSDAVLAPGYGKEDLPSNEFRLRLMDTLGVRYVLDRAENPRDEQTFPKNRFQEIRRVDDWIIYKNLLAAPRIFTTGDVRPYGTQADFESKFFAPDFNPSKTVLVAFQDWNTLPQFDGKSTQGAVSILRYEPTTIKLTVTTENQQFLFISDTFDAGWTATVNGKPTAVYKTDFALRGIVVPRGSSAVEFSYNPRSFETGLAISVTALLATAVYLLFQRRSGQRPRQLSAEDTRT